MPKRLSRPRRPSDINQLAHQLVEDSTQEASGSESELSRLTVSRVMAEMGRKGGKISGARRKENIPEEKRSEIALKAAKARWAKKTRS